MNLEEKQGGNHTILRLEGFLKVGDTARAFTEKVERIAVDRPGALILDLSELEYMDSTGVGVLVGALRRFQAEERQIHLVAPQRRILTGLRVTHLDTLFRIHDNLDLALASVAMAGHSEEETGGR